MPRTGWAEGSVYQAKGRRRWTAAWPFVDPVTGARHTRTAQVHDETAGWAVIKEWRGLTDTEHHAATTAPLTLRELAGLWLSELDPKLDRDNLPGHTFTEDRVSDPTWRDYESVVATHILPDLGGMQLDELNVRQIRAFVDALPARQSSRGGPLSADRVTNVYRRLHQVLSYGVARTYIRSHPMTGMHAPTPVRRSQDHAAEMSSTERALTVDELDRMLEWAAASYADHPDYRIRLRLGAETGMRQAEVCGLTWDRVDTRRRIITVWQVLTNQVHQHGCEGEWGGRGVSPCTLAAREAAGNRTLKPITALRCPQRIDGGWYIDTDTKAHRQRRVPITQGLADDLAGLRARQHPAGSVLPKAEVRRLAGARARQRYPAADADLVFRAERGGGHVSKSLDNTVLHRGLAAAGIPAAGRTVHALRHTAATAMIAAGIPLPEVQVLLGHSSLTVLQRYYAGASVSVSTADRLDAYLSAQRS